MTTDDHSLMEIWNSETMRGLRRDMVEGRRIGPCEACYTDEERGAVSLRQRDNRAWEQGWLNEERATIDDMVTLAVDNDFHLPKLPVMMEVETGNLCNLKCRMCNSFNSSLIAKDPVQKAWESSPHACYIDPNFERNDRKFRRVGPIEALAEELDKETASRIRRLYFIGGEPFLVRELPRLLERLIAVGRARQISLLFVTNGTVVPEWLSLAAQFKRVDLSLSIDGYEDDYEDIRYNGQWSELVQNIQLFKKIPNPGLVASTTIQVNNVLRLADLFRYRFGRGRFHRLPVALSALPGGEHIAVVDPPPGRGPADEIMPRPTAGRSIARWHNRSRRNAKPARRAATRSCCATSCCTPTTLMRRVARASTGMTPSWSSCWNRPAIPGCMTRCTRRLPAQTRKPAGGGWP